MPHIDMTSVIFGSKMFNVHILLSGDFHRIELHMYAIYLCAIFLATLAFKLSLDVTIIVDNTKGFTVHTTRGIRVLICSSACFRAQCVDFKIALSKTDAVVCF